MPTLERWFIALPLPEALREPLGEWARDQRARLPFQTWVHPADYHLTLAFLGDTDTALAPDIVAAMQRSRPAGGFTLRLGEPGCFGKPAAPSVLWLAVGGASKPLQALQAALAAELTPLGFAPEQRAYKPHLTLARRWGGTGAAPRPGQPGAPKLPPGLGSPWRAEELALYRSRLNRRPMYEPVARVPLPEALPAEA